MKVSLHCGVCTAPWVCTHGRQDLAVGCGSTLYLLPAVCTTRTSLLPSSLPSLLSLIGIFRCGYVNFVS